MTHPILASSLSVAEPVAAPDQAFGPVVLRPLRSTEAFAAHLKRLDERGRRLRFGSPVNDGFIDSYVKRQCAGDAEIIGLFVAGTLRGVAELCLHPSDSTGAEGAFSLERAFRGRGLGTQLFEALLDAARRLGIASLTLQFLRENVAMQRIARRFSAELTFDQSEVTARIAVRPKTPARLSPFAMTWPAQVFSSLQSA